MVHDFGTPPVFHDDGARSQVLMDGMTNIYQRAGEYLYSLPETHRQYSQNFEYFQHTATQVLGIVNERDRLYYMSHLQPDSVNFGLHESEPHVFRSQERRRPRRRNAPINQEVQDDAGPS